MKKIMAIIVGMVMFMVCSGCGSSSKETLIQDNIEAKMLVANFSENVIKKMTSEEKKDIPESEKEVKNKEEEKIHSITSETLWRIGNYFYFLPFETGDPTYSTVQYGNIGKQEVYIGVLAFTTVKNYSGIQNMLAKLAEIEPEFCRLCKEYSVWSDQKVIEDISSGKDSKIVQLFVSLDEEDHSRFFVAQLNAAEMYYKEVIEELNLEWIYQRDPIFVGTMYSLINWLPYGGWEKVISESNTDSNNLWLLYNEALSKSSPVNHGERWTEQFSVAFDLMR